MDLQGKFSYINPPFWDAVVYVIVYGVCFLYVYYRRMRYEHMVAVVKLFPQLWRWYAQPQPSMQ